MMTAAEVMKQSRVFLNDQQDQLYHDDVLLPFLQTALDELGEMFEENGLPATNKLSSVIPVTTTQYDIGGPTGPALPSDLVEIQEVYERWTGTNNPFVKMTRVDFLPELNVLTSSFIYYAWKDQIITFLGATTNIDIQLEYIANTFGKLISASSLIKIINSKTTLSYRTAGLAASNIGENKDRADELNGFASNAAERLMNISAKGQQAISTRRRPFRAGYKGGYIY